MQRYWVSWYSFNYAKDGCTSPPFQAWVTGETMEDEWIFCALVEANKEADVWDAIKRHYPDYRMRFINDAEPDWIPNNRFPDFENRTSLTFEKETE